MDLATSLAQFKLQTVTPEKLAGQVAVWADLAAKQRHEIYLKDIKIAALTLELAYHKRIKFQSTSEAFTAQQRDLFDETQETDLNAIQAELTQLSSKPRTKAKPTGRKPFPAELPRIEQRHEPESCSCGACGQMLVKIREDITEQLYVEPAKFSVERHIRPQYACRQCETITAAAIPASIIDGGLATPSLHAWVVIQNTSIIFRCIESNKSAHAMASRCHGRP